MAILGNLVVMLESIVPTLGGKMSIIEILLAALGIIYRLFLANWTTHSIIIKTSYFVYKIQFQLLPSFFEFVLEWKKNPNFFANGSMTNHLFYLS